jgi:hypothetical protein
MLELLVDSELKNILKAAWITSRLERFGKEINLQPTSTRHMPGQHLFTNVFQLIICHAYH